MRLHIHVAGGRIGAWRVERMSAVIGPPLPAVDRVAVSEDQHLPDPQWSAWLLQGVASHERYVQRRERSALGERQLALGRPEATRVALIPIRKSAAWWELAQDERRAISQRVPVTSPLALPTCRQSLVASTIVATSASPSIS